MDIDGAVGRRVPRGRVVVLVDNRVEGDSRVQKVARSAAAAGWDTTLLGRSPDERPHEWSLGDAQVRLLPMPEPLARRRHEFRRAWLHWPLAYPPTGIAPHRAQSVRAWQADLRIRAAQLRVAARSGGAGPRLWLRRQLLGAQRLAAGVTRRWVSLRYWMLTQRRRRQRLDHPWDRAYTWFWQAVLKERAWRRLEPGLWDYELAYAETLDQLAPDLIHANDFRMLGVGARAVIRARAAGRQVKLVWDAHEFLPGVKPWRENLRWLPANRAHEREYAPYADAVVTVSAGLAELLRQEHGLAESPTVVLNAPIQAEVGAAGEDVEAGGAAGAAGEDVGAVGAAGAAGADRAQGIRDLCGLDADVPLLVYSGAALPQRGLGLMVEALPLLPGVHVAFVVNKPDGGYLQRLRAHASELGVADRVHVHPYVPHWRVVSFLASADVGVIPIAHYPNHEIALITKFFEYSHARLPIVVSDVKTMAETVRATGQGEVFRAGDAADFGRAVAAVLADRHRYTAAYDAPGLLDGWTWESQAEILDGVYRRLSPEAGDGTAPAPTVDSGQSGVVAQVRAGAA